jgi:Tfp pilus assembly protein PilN
MRALELDFVQPGRRSRRGGLLLLVAAVIAAFTVVSWRTQLQAEMEALESELARLERHAQGLAPVAVRIDEAAEQEIRRANEVIDQITLPWGRLFHAVEGAAMGQVALLGIAPDAKAGTVQVSAEATDSEAMFDYIARLEKQPELANVYLLQHQRERRSATRQLRFVVTASWLERQAR